MAMLLERSNAMGVIGAWTGQAARDAHNLCGGMTASERQRLDTSTLGRNR